MPSVTLPRAAGSRLPDVAAAARAAHGAAITHNHSLLALDRLLKMLGQAAQPQPPSPGAAAVTDATWSAHLQLAAAGAGGASNAAARREMHAAAAAAARNCALTRLLWRPLTGDASTRLLCMCSASELDLPATLDTLALARNARLLRTRPRPNRRRPPPTMAALAAMLQAVQAQLPAAEVATAKLEPVVSASSQEAPLGLEYDTFAEALTQLHRPSKDGSEVGVLKRLVRRLLGDVRRLALSAGEDIAHYP